MTPYIEQPTYKNNQFEDIEWGHFIDIDYGFSHVSNRYRSITCPVIHGNKVYQKPYTYDISRPGSMLRTREQPDNVDNNYSLIEHPILYIAKKIFVPCINLFIDRTKKEEDTNDYNNTKIQTTQPLIQMSIIKHHSLSELSCHNQNTRKITKSQFHTPVLNYTYPIYEVDEVDEVDYYNEDYLGYPDKMNPFTMVIVSFVSMCSVYMMF